MYWLRKLVQAIAALCAAAVAAVLPWWVIGLIQPRPGGVLFRIGEAILDMRSLTPQLVLEGLWVHGAIFGAELLGAGVVAFLFSGGRLSVGWGLGAAIGAASLLLALLEPLFWTVVPRLPDRPYYQPEDSPTLHLLHTLMMSLHLLAMAVLPQVGGVLGALAARRRGRMAARSPRAAA